jgi:hypothetical protein
MSAAAAEKPPSRRRIALAISFVLVALGLIAYARILFSFFLSDDFWLIAAVARHGPFGAWTDRQSMFFRPLVSCSLFLDYLVWGLNPIGFHLTSVLLHSLNGCLAAWIAVTLLPRRRLASTVAVALTVGVCFILSPSHTESVSWISGRTDVLATVFFLASLLVYLIADRHGHTRTRLAWCLAFYACALLSKEQTIVLPLVIAVHWQLSNRDGPAPLRRAAPFAVGFLIVAGAYLVARRNVIGQVGGGYGSIIPADTTPWGLADGLCLFMARSVLPPQMWISDRWVGAGLWLLLIGTLVWQSRTSLVGSGLLSTVAALAVAAQATVLPALNLTISSADTQGERFVYLSSAFTIMFIGSAAGLLAARVGMKSLILLCPLVLSAFYVLHQANENWETAGRISGNVLGSLEAAVPSGNAVVLNIPDSIRGAYIFRNGLPEAMELFAPVNRATIRGPLVYQALNRPTDRVLLARGNGKYTLQLLDGGMWMGPGGSTLTPSKAVEVSGTGLTERGTIVYYSAGRMEIFNAVPGLNK